MQTLASLQARLLELKGRCIADAWSVLARELGFFLGELGLESRRVRIAQSS
jgi:hypothetical protein